MSEYLNAAINRISDGVIARASDVNTLRDETSAGLDKLPTELELKQGKTNYATDTGAANAYVVTLPYAPASYADGMEVVFKASNTNTGASTINVNGLGVKSIVGPDGSDVSANDIVAGAFSRIRYNATSGKFLFDSFGRIATALSASAAATSASNAATSETNAEASRVAADKRYLGEKAANPTADNQGAALQAGAVYYNSVTGRVMTWSGTAWVEGIAAVAGVTSLNGRDGALTLLTQTPYDSRAALRSLTPTDGDLVLIEEIGMFRWYSGNTELDDDETCFATASGRWLLECLHWDAVEAFASTVDDDQSSRVEDSEAAITSAEAAITSAEAAITSAEARWPGRILHGSAACAITSVAAVTQVSFTATVTGAAIGDRVIATPPDAIGARIACYARVTAASTVTIYLNNPSAASQTIATGTWTLSVIQEV